MNPNVLFILYCLIAIPIFCASSPLSAYSIGQFIGYSIIPIILVAIYNFKKTVRLSELLQVLSHFVDFNNRFWNSWKAGVKNVN